MKKRKETSQLEQIITKANSLALDILDEILEYRRQKKNIDLDSIKAPLLAIKEIKDLIKVNDKIKQGQISDLLNIDFEDYNSDLEEDLSNIINLEEALNEKES